MFCKHELYSEMKFKRLLQGKVGTSKPLLRLNHYNANRLQHILPFIVNKKSVSNVYPRISEPFCVYCHFRT